MTRGRTGHPRQTREYQNTRERENRRSCVQAPVLVYVCSLPGSGNRIIARHLFRMGACVEVVHSPHYGSGVEKSLLQHNHPKRSVALTIRRDPEIWEASVRDRHPAWLEPGRKEKALAYLDEELPRMDIERYYLPLTQAYTNPEATARYLAYLTGLPFQPWPDKDTPFDCDEKWRTPNGDRKHDPRARHDQ